MHNSAAAQLRCSMPLLAGEASSKAIKEAGQLRPASRGNLAPAPTGCQPPHLGRSGARQQQQWTARQEPKWSWSQATPAYPNLAEHRLDGQSCLLTAAPNQRTPACRTDCLL